MICDRRSLKDPSGAPHISHVLKDGWFWKVHRGHDFELTGLEDFDRFSISEATVPVALEEFGVEDPL